MSWSGLPNVRYTLAVNAPNTSTVVGERRSIVYARGPLALSSAFTGPTGGPKDFDIVINFTTPFLYNPFLGNLLLDVRNFGGGLTTQFDAQFTAGDAVRRAYTEACCDVTSSAGRGFTLGKALATAPDLQNEIGPVWPHPNVENAARWMVSLPLWREFLFEDQRLGATDAPSYLEEASAFAHHVAAAMTVLLRPWLDGRLRMRPRVLRRWTQMLDSIAGENMTINSARSRGAVSELAILEFAAGNEELRAHLVRQRDQLQANGMSEQEMAALILRGSRPGDEIVAE